MMMLLFLSDLFVGEAVVLLGHGGGGHGAFAAQAAAARLRIHASTAHEQAGGENKEPEDRVGGLGGHGGIISIRAGSVSDGAVKCSLFTVRRSRFRL